MNNLKFRLQAVCLALMLGIVSISAQEIRYVKEGGTGAKNGLSWDNAYANIQDAINDLVNNNLSGEVWVAAGHYYPTETTESSSSPYYKSFKIPAGITVRGGFKSDLDASSDKVNDTTTRPLKDDKNFGKAGSKEGNLDGEGAKSGKYVNETILHGDLTPGKNATFAWNSNKQQFDVTFYGNSYHVVWFAMNGFSAAGRANPLAKPAKLEGCVVQGGHAFSSNTTSAHPHIAYGGGIYMVANSFVYNCEVRNCDASRNGGGIYMDGGGIVRRTYVHDCQALGLGTEYGMGGGICEDGAAHNSKSNPVVVAQSVVTNCVGRQGGGMALVANQTVDKNKYSVVANSTIVNNNTAQVEAGGVYTYKGGAVASMTIVRNKCFGTGVMQNEVATGRSGGLYSRDAAYVANSVLWGNECSSNNDVQYASSQSSLNSQEKSKFLYNALSKADNTDWSYSTKMGLLSLADKNKSAGEKTSKGFPLFFKPTDAAGYLPEAVTDETLNWEVSSESFLSYAGIATVDLDYEGLTPAPAGKSWDMQFGEFNSRPTIGALISQVSDIAPATDITYEGVKYDYAFFVDPDFIYADDNEGDNGTDWEHPARFLGSVLDFIEHPAVSHNFGSAPDFTGKKVAVFVKQGTIDNTRIGGHSRVRVTTLDVPSNVSLFGSFNSQLAGTDLSLQNVVHTPSIISGKLMDQYDLNVAHLINIENKHDIHIHGFKISYANASSTKLDNTNTNGAAITVVNSEDIMFHDVIVNNCTADHGAAVYADKSTVLFENCIFHNNESKTLANSGIVYGVNGSVLDFNHCDVLRNVGHASYIGSNGTSNNWQNSIFYGNLNRSVGDTNIDSAAEDPLHPGLNKYSLEAFSGNTANVLGSHCMFDAKSASFATQMGGNDTGSEWQYNLQYAFADGTGKGYPRFINPTKNAGVTEDGDQTYYGRATSFEPHNNNPIVNMASHADIHTSWGRDIVDVTRDFGGLPDIGAVENHVASQFEEGENAYTDGQKPYGDAYYVRDYASGSGTNMDTFNQDGTKNAEGKGIYNAAGELLDGTSWEYAVNGNGMYATEAIVAHDLNTIFKTEVTHQDAQFAGTFTISSRGYTSTYYLRLNGTTPELTTNASLATHFEVEGVDTETMAAGTRYIRQKIDEDNYLYLNTNGNNKANTSTNQVQATISGSGTFTIRVNNRYYNRSNSNLSIGQSGSTSWTFTPDITGAHDVATEIPLKQDETELDPIPAPTSVSAGNVFDPLKFHVYRSLDDYNKSTTKVTYKIKRSANDNALKNTTNTNYLYPTNTTAEGDNFILLQDGEYGKYYIYDVTTSKYLYYYAGGTAGTSRVRMGAESSKTTWWIDLNNGVLNIVYGGQPWTTTGNYAITCSTYATRNNPVVSIGQKTAVNAALVLVANTGYNAYKYQETSRESVNLNGLQYAVNNANEKFAADQKVREVSVAKGIYTNKSDANGSSTVEQPYAYMIKEGVNVYGGFPENGNPGMNERQPKKFETVLQPDSKDPYVTMSFPTNPSSTQKNYMEISKWGDYITNINGNEPASEGRVLVQPLNFDVKTAWDGFTIRHGYLQTAYMYNIGAELKFLVPADIMAAGGAGVLLQENGVLTNCIVKNNMIVCYPNGSNLTKLGDHASTADANSLYTYHMSGAGIFMGAVVNPSSRKQVTGVGAVVENCEVANNQIITKAYKRIADRADNIWAYGAGIYQNGGNVYNTIIHDNDAVTLLGNANADDFGTGADKNNEMILGSGTFVASGNFYNNTIVNNLACTLFHNHDNHCSFAGVHVFDEAKIYNSIIADNKSHWGYEGWGKGTKPGNGVPVSAFMDTEAGRTSRDASKVHVLYSYVDVNVGAKTDAGTTTEALQDLVSQNDTQHTNVYLNRAQYANTTVADNTYTSEKIYNKAGETGTTDTNKYHIFATSPAFNSGTDDIANVTIPDYDAEYTDRIKDCAIDMGAYEFNGAAAVAPTVTGEQAVFYVTHNGKGAMTATDATNAACAAKLQIVLDAAGRYKYLNPTKQVIVKVANDKAMQEANSDFTYYATRTTDQTDQDVRVWSIMVPRGVEVWGGYTDVPMKMVDDKVVKDTEHEWSEATNGFYTRTGTSGNYTYTDLRDIIANPTYFDSHYVNKLEKTDANTYHVVTFTDRIFDVNGLAYTKEDFKGKSAEQVRTILSTGAPTTYIELPGNDESIFAHMSESFGGYTGVSGNVIMDGASPKQIAGNYASNRAVIDGIFVSGGQADASTNSTSSTVNINSYGGAALVNEFAYVRNCVLVGNTASNGGALALTNNALVTGCLIMENEAQYNGGGIYVFEDGTKLSDGRVISSEASDGQAMDYNMAHVITSTIVNNNANEDGGGVWYTTDYNTNVRFNSVAIWSNTAKGQENVYGMVNPEQPTDDETISEQFYPFSYSIIQNIRASGTNNLNVSSTSRQGVRFVQRRYDVDKLNNLIHMANEDGTTDEEKDFGFYGLTTYSLLSSAGMPKTLYNQLKAAVAIADNDLLGTTRVDNNEDNIFVEVGARALAKQMPKKQLMLRLFVAHPEDVNTDVATSFMELAETATAGTAEEYYSQEGSSFAYPFNSLQQALDYVKLARNGKIISGNNDAQNLPFEILVGKGEWYPKRSLNSETQNVWAATYAIPEGVTIMGGFNPTGGGDTYYGRYYKKGTSFSTAEGSIYDNVESIPTSGYSGEKPANDVSRGYNFANEIVNGKTFQQWHIQDIADRRAMSDINKNGIIEPWEFTNQTIISGNAVNGETDGVYHIMTAVADANAVGLMPKVQSSDNSWSDTGYKVKEVGQQIRLNGLVVTGGNALTYLSTALDAYGSYIFYQGAGLQVDGNRYNTTIGGTPTFHNSAAYGVGYRDIPVSITNCQFRNNKAGYGGAISTNGSLSLFASSFEQNIAYANTEKAEDGDNWKDINGNSIAEVNYPGQGGAILATLQLSAFNTMFANNEARHIDATHAASIDLFSHKSFRVPSGAAGTLRAAGGAIMMGSAAEHHIVNCDFVRNKANMYPAVFTMNPTKQQNEAVNTHDYSQIINTVAWGNEVNKISSDANYLFASKMMVNVGKADRSGAYSPVFSAAPASQADLDNTANKWQEAVWFCAYEDGVGFTPDNTNDLRDLIVYNAGTFAPKMIMDVNGGVYQNCNILISADNRDVAGPNFGNPSVEAGYDGFMEGADWSPARFNRLTDNGNGWIKQTVTPQGNDYVVTFNTGEGNKTGYQGAYPYTHFISDIIPGAFPEYKLWLAIGNEKYMEAASDKMTEDVTINGVEINRQMNLPRISPDPVKGMQKAYIDIGVYEYIKPKVIVPGSEVDILWVSTEEKPENGAATGLTWKTPMTDLQLAIETLLSSRNGHKKEIRLMEGEYAPITPKKVGDKKYSAFVIDTKSLNERAITPSTFTGTNNDKFYAQSITIKGGYSSMIPYEYDPVTYKTTIRQNEATDGSSTDYLIYVADPTVRYAYAENGYTPANNYGAKVDGAADEQARSVKTMPIQVDGVTLINDKAATNTKGSAIYYPDYTGSTPPEAGVTGAHNVSAGGKVVYYKNQEEFEKYDSDGKHIGETVDYETDYAEVTSEGSNTISDTKILITKAEVIASGNEANPGADASAVYIGEKGGAAMIYNSVFHSNYGMPLDAWNTINVNNTFAKNAGLVQLRDNTDVSVKSQIHNSALWMNNGGNAQFSMPNVSVVTDEGETKGDVSGSGKDNFTYNSFTGGNIMYADYTDGSGHVAGNNYNTGLSNENKDIANGPNFVDTDNVDIEARSFDIRPSVRLLNKGNDESITTGTGKYYTLVVSNKYDFSLASTTDKDVLNRARLAANRIDIGAYEFQGNLQKVLYVDPNKTHSDAATGENWNDAFGYDDLQNAVDLAGIYHMNNPEDESYVFVKGASSTNKNLNTNETLTIRDGVTVYGSIISSYTDWHEIEDEHGSPKYANIEDFIKDMTSQREGVASDAASKTIVTGIKTSEYTSFNGNGGSTPALVDGFVVTDPNPAKAPVLDVTNPSKDAAIVLRNILVADNTISNEAEGNDVNVAQISNGLIYEALFRDNKPKGNGAVLKVANNPDGAYNAEATTTRGFAVNVTVEGRTVGADGTEPVDGVSTNGESGAQIFKSITNSINSGDGANAAGKDAPYRTITNKGISGYFYNIADPNLNYQLTETSKYIDMCELDVDANGNPDFLPANLKSFVHYSTDRDILGNPRLMVNVSNADRIDRGAFETWRIDKNFICGANGTNKSQVSDDIVAHFYPHDGSVVYIMENKSLVIDPLGAEDVKATPHNPGFMLVKEGANFYGNGRPATCAYLAVERKVKNGGSIVSIPYAMQYNENVSKPIYVGGELSELDANVVEGAYEYNGLKRSDWKYIFQAENTKCWTPISNKVVTAANHGVLFQAKPNNFDDDVTEVLLRFTGKGTGLADYIYTEQGVSKDVTLTKYDDAESTNNGADYTDERDMGWNCFGIPYLVSEYKPYQKVTVANASTNTVTEDNDGQYAMNIPHTLWLYYNGTQSPDGTTTKPTMGDGGYYNVKSWQSTNAAWHVTSDAERAIWVGEGIFTQTATLDDTESLKFYLPVAPASFPASAPAKAVTMARYYAEATGVMDKEMTDEVELIATEYYTTDGVRMNSPRRGAVVIVRKVYSNGVVKTSKQFVK